MSSSKLPTLYEYFNGENGMKIGLSDNQEYFTLNNKTITIYSGALHYFRVPEPYWRDRLRKYRAAGLNTVETYVPWNLHEPEEGTFDFGNGISDLTDFLDIVKFINVAKQEDLFVILRPGPYICAEWEFGGLPSWLLKYPNIKIRTNDKQFISFVRRYFKKLFELVAPLQFTKGGAIIAIQIENEYGNTEEVNKPIDSAYLETLKDMFTEYGLVELFFTSDTPSNGFSGTIPGVLATANFQKNPEKELHLLKEFQPSKPLIVMEYWTGWFDHWTEKHHSRSLQEFGEVLEKILQLNSSFNMYMFHGGTNWGFLNGGNISGTASDNEGYAPDVTTYDYDAPLSESGDYTDKYMKTQEILKKYNQLKVKQLSLPEPMKKVAYPNIQIVEEIPYQNLLDQIKFISSKNLIPMEMLPINNNNGQSYGYIVYRKININISKNSILSIEGRVCDTVMVMVNGKLKSHILREPKDLYEFGYWKLKNSSLNLGNDELKNATIDLVVENWGRVNYGKLHQFNQKKGIYQGNVLLNNEVMEDWQIFPLEFKKSWMKKLTGFQKPTFGKRPTLYKAILTTDNPTDTYVDMRKWTKGFIIINHFVLGRYCLLGPQKSMYLPAPLLNKGDNEILIFEHFTPAKEVEFTEKLIFEEHLE